MTDRQMDKEMQPALDTGRSTGTQTRAGGHTGRTPCSGAGQSGTGRREESPQRQEGGGRGRANGTQALAISVMRALRAACSLRRQGYLGRSVRLIHGA